MGCEFVPLPDGYAVICSRGRRGKQCSACKRNPATLECDWPLTGSKAGKTCDRPLCRPCALLVKQASGDTVDYCPAHAAQHRGESTCPTHCEGKAPQLHLLTCPRSPHAIRKAMRAEAERQRGQVGLFEPEATRGLFTPPVKRKDRST